MCRTVRRAPPPKRGRGRCSAGRKRLPSPVRGSVRSSDSLRLDRPDRGRQRRPAMWSSPRPRAERGGEGHLRHLPCAEAAALPSIGYQRTLTAESIAALDPTVVLANTLAGHPTRSLPAGLRAPSRCSGRAAGCPCCSTAPASPTSAPSSGSTRPVRRPRRPCQPAGFARRPRRHNLGPRVRRRRRWPARPTRQRPRPDPPTGEDHRILAYEDQYLLGFGPRTGAVLADLAPDLHPELEESR